LKHISNIKGTYAIDLLLSDVEDRKQLLTLLPTNLNWDSIKYLDLNVEKDLI